MRPQRVFSVVERSRTNERDFFFYFLLKRNSKDSEETHGSKILRKLEIPTVKMGEGVYICVSISYVC